MTSYQRAVPVLQVANVEKSVRWYVDVLGFVPDTFPQDPPYSFAILRREGAEIMLQCQSEGRKSPSSRGTPDGEFVWSIYLRISDTGILALAACVSAVIPVLRGPERMFYGLVEFEVCDPDGYRICISGEVPPGAEVEVRED